MWSKSASDPVQDEVPNADDQLDEDAPGPAISVPDSGEGGKLKMIVQLVKKSLGVKDIAAMRLSLPASLLEPIPNLEYWHYLDRPDFFAAINDSADPFERMLAVLRFTFTKDLKHLNGKVVKPYNSVLGEHFRAHWDFLPVLYSEDPSQQSLAFVPQVYTHQAVRDGASTTVLAGEESASIRSGKSSRSGMSIPSSSKQGSGSSTAATSIEPNIEAQTSTLSLADPDQSQASSSAGESDGDGDGAGDGKKLRIAFLTEQVSHHPPVSTFYASCPERKIEMTGVDQISAKVSGTTLRVSSGSFNKGIFVRLTGGPGEGEEYHITHPVASVNGILRGSFYVTIGDSTIVTCTGGRASGELLRAIIEYKEESWIGRAQYLVEGVIHTYDPSETVHDEWTKVKHVPASRVIATFDGSWRNRIKWRRVQDWPSSGDGSAVADTTCQPSLPKSKSKSASSSKADVGGAEQQQLLIDMSALATVPMRVRPLSKQLPNESRKLWEKVTSKLLTKEFGDATKEKVLIEQRQREEAAERKKKGVEFVPRYFETDWTSGYPKMTEEGRRAVEEELAETATKSTT